MTLHDLITSDVSDVFLNTDDFGTRAVHYKAGSLANKETVTVIVDQDEEANSGTGHGDGMMIDDKTGSEIRRAYRLEMSVAVQVTEVGQGTGDSPSLFSFRDEYGNDVLVKAHRIVGKDHAMQTVLCTSTDRRAVTRRNVG